MEHPFSLACPSCGMSLEKEGEDVMCCSKDGRHYVKDQGIWRMLRPGRESTLEKFVTEYETVRHAEGRGSRNADYYRALPNRDLTGKRSNEWMIRAQSFDTFLKKIIIPLEGNNALRIIDLGAGNCWLSYQLAKRRHHLAAVDLTINDMDGLGAYIHYDLPFLVIQAEFDFLPFSPSQADLVIFNASLHYSSGYRSTLQEALRVMADGGRIAIVDSPFYLDGRSGEQMVRERHHYFQQKYGFRSDALASRNYFTYRRLEQLCGYLGTKARLYWPVSPWRWAVRRWRSRLRQRREPAQFPLVVLERL